MKQQAKTIEKRMINFYLFNTSFLVATKSRFYDKKASVILKSFLEGMGNRGNLRKKLTSFEQKTKLI
jgi:hypothetical protein